MSVNQSYGINPTKTARFGKYFSTIDFEFGNVSKTLLEKFQDQTSIGNLLIGNRKFPIKYCDLYEVPDIEMNLTKFEQERIVETLETAKNILFQKIRLGV